MKKNSKVLNEEKR